MKRRIAATDIEALRTVSRRKYLKIREERKLKELKDEVEDDDDLFEGVKVSKWEEQNMKYKKDLLKIMGRANNKELEEEDYSIPDDYEYNQVKRFSVATMKQRYDDDDKPNPNPNPNPNDWEENQMRKAASLKYKGQDDSEYKLMFDEEDFIKMMMDKKTDFKREITFSEKSLRSVLHEERKKLPIYALRDDFLEAVRDHQIIVIVGETGSG
jgi:pre-mRNA-splicing factor ATP-dependent RNA helicase DHX16